jgi:hypothetical protein
MDIAGILRGFTSPAVGSQSNSTKEQTALAPDTAGPQFTPAAAAPSAEFRDILARYDVQNISPRQFSELVQQLREAGVISEADYQELASMRLSLDEQSLDPDGPLNLIEFFHEKLEQAEEALQKREAQQPGSAPIDRPAALADSLRQIGWIQKFALVNRSAEYQPLDAVA